MKTLEQIISDMQERLALIEQQGTAKHVQEYRERLYHVETNKDYFNRQGDNLKQCPVCLSAHAEKHVACFHCDLWDFRVNDTWKTVMIIDGELYSDGGMQERTNYC